MNLERLFVFSLLLLVTFNSVSAEVEVSYFYGTGCPHCANVVEKGILERVNDLENVSIQKYEIYHDQEGRNLYYDFLNLLGLRKVESGIPFVFVNCSGKYAYLIGDKPIINSLEETVRTCEGLEFGDVSPSEPYAKELTLGSIILAALIDSINPCAFGVLIFLMISLLKIGSNKRALRAGLVYTFVVFMVYFLSGFGIFKVIQSFTFMTRFIYLFVGLLVLILSILTFVDFVRVDKESIIKISKKVKPLLEKYIHQGTIPAMIFLGILVSLFELPCTGGIYLAILSMMSMNKTFGIGYLALYNLIFILPLIIITVLISKGINPENLQKWTASEKRWMKLASGIVLFILSIYFLWSLF